MKITPLLLSLLLMVVAAKAQDDKFITTQGKIHFFSSTALENIEALSTETACVLNVTTKKVNAKVKMTSFHFPNKLMEEHFNENYVESETYPYAVLDAVIVDNIDFTKDGNYDITLKGTFDLHGVKKEREIKGKLIIKNGVPTTALATFYVKLADHKIKVPSAVGANLAEEIKIDVIFDLHKYTK